MNAMLAKNRYSFRDRTDAGGQLAAALDRYGGGDVLVLGIPRGGVPVAAEVARRLGGELDVIVARKLGAPLQPELAIGAVTANGGLYLDRVAIDELGVPDSYLKAAIGLESAEARRREELFRGARPAAPIEGRTVIVVDDGLATGATMRAALRSVAKHGPERLIAAVPVGAADSLAMLRAEADEVVCLLTPEPFWAVGLYYQEFEPVEDQVVMEILAADQVPFGDAVDSRHEIAEAAGNVALESARG